MKYLILILTVILGACGPLAPKFQEWDSKANLIKQTVEGEALLKKAESERKVQIEDAKGKLEAATLLAEAEVDHVFESYCVRIL